MFIFIDLEIKESLINYENRFQKYLNRTREELTGQIETDKDEMIKWIKSYVSRRDDMYKLIQNEQCIYIKNMNELIYYSNNIEQLVKEINNL